QKRDSAGQARQDRHGENVPASLERQTVRVHAQGGVSAVPVGGEAEQWHGSFLSLWGLALILPRNRPRRGGTEADQTRPSRWRVAAFRATVRPRADRYAQPQEHTACQPLRRSHPDSAVWVLAASATVAAMSRRRAARSVSPFRSAMSAPVVRWRMLFCISVSLLSSLVTATLRVSIHPCQPGQTISKSEKRTTRIPASALYRVATMRPPGVRWTYSTFQVRSRVRSVRNGPETIWTVSPWPMN